MRRFSRGLILAALMISLTVSGGAAAEKKPLEGGFTPLFNGKDLAGWKVKGGASLAGQTEVRKGRIRVADDRIVIDGKTKGNLVIDTEKQFAGDVVIRFEYLPGPGCNNDLYFRGNKFDIRKGGVKNLEEGKWHLFEIVVKGDAVEFRSNGQLQRAGKVKDASPLGIRAEFGAIEFRNLGYRE